MAEELEVVPPVEDKIKPPVNPDGLDDNDRASAVSLYKALRDPDTANELIENLARRAGLLDKKGDLKDDKPVTKTELGRITKKLKAALGKDYDTFSDKVGPLLDDAITEYLEEHGGKVESRRSGDKWENEVEKFTETHELTTKIEDAMKDIMKHSPPNFKSEGFSAQKYLSRMYKLALEELGEKPPKDKKSESRNDFPDFEVRNAPKVITLDDAIDAAMKGIRFKHNN